MPPNRSGNMPPMVRTRSTTAVPLPAAGGAELPDPGRLVPLSPFDAFWVALPPVRRVFLFRSLPRVPFSDVVGTLRSSLAQVLPAFHPFAGELTYSPDSRALSIVLPDEREGCSCRGVTFVEAETDLDFERLVEEGSEHDQDALGQLVPNIRRDQLPAPVMAAQVTEFVGGGGGVALGVALHHTAADGRGIWRFLEMWAAAAAGGRVPAGSAALHDRRLVRFHGDEELAGLFLQQIAPNLPRIAPKQDPALDARRRLSRRTFTFAASAVRRLKQRLASAANIGTAPSTFAALAAHGWVSIARASGFADDAPVFAAFLADCRAYVSPPVPEAYAGNCVALCTASLSGSVLAGPDGPARALLAVREAVAEVKRDPLRDRARWWTKFTAIPPGRAVVLVGSPWFPAYGLDFGFGRPARVELASMNNDGEMVLVAGREAGSVQASVSIAAGKMQAFRDVFMAE
ncbi:anthocyanin 5-aromatic acyltransferase-like [Triticum dicoccoides]|uniref:anthocyanin 5-aromatic acyltransferase-like n=1 Tax=Triticum dicoccoides TaxID=85692 RepID=UPI001891792B|nr:anthocyanin 5-aromatic acyltransferase-like [Triticum dicoccoides]